MEKILHWILLMCLVLVASCEKQKSFELKDYATIENLDFSCCIYNYSQKISNGDTATILEGELMIRNYSSEPKLILYDHFYLAANDSIPFRFWKTQPWFEKFLGMPGINTSIEIGPLDSLSISITAQANKTIGKEEIKNISFHSYKNE